MDEESDIEFQDDHEYIIATGTGALYEACEWDVPFVRVLENGEGEPLALVAICQLHGRARTRHGLPTEFFSHQLVELDYKNPYELASFMNEYGFMGPVYNKFLEDQQFLEALENLNVSDNESIRLFEEKYHYFPSVAQTHLMLNNEESSAHYKDLKQAVKALSVRLREQQPDTLTFDAWSIRGLVSIPRAQYLYEDWLFCASHIKAMVQYHTPKDIAKALGEDECSVIRSCEGACNIVQRYLNNIHPTLDVIDLSAEAFVSDGDWSHRGSFGQALALQLWMFVHESKESYSICKECHGVFVHRQSRTKSSQSRSSSQFCCDKCKNRYSQRQHRKSPGYQLRQKRDSKQ